MREHEDEIRRAGATIVAIGTGNQRYAAAFARDEQIDFPVLVDDDARAANAAAVRTVGWFELLHPHTWPASLAASRRGHHVHRAGKRVKQLGATFVIGPGEHVRYSHIDRDSTDHAALDDILGALAARS